jgi:Tol biopolymer transport system component
MAALEIVRCADDLTTQTGSTIATVSIAGGPIRRLTEPDLWGGGPDWSPAGDEIAFGTYPLYVKDMSKPSTVYTIMADGSGLTAITDGIVDGRTRTTAPHWTPDGQGFVVSIAIGSGDEIRDVRPAYLGLDGTVTPLALDTSGVGATLRPTGLEGASR